MRKITQTIVGTTPPLDKNVLWLDTTNSNSPVEKVFLNGEWIPTSAAGGDYYTKDEVDENFMSKINNPNVGNILVMDGNGKAVDSLKKPADFLANAVNEGQDGQVLSLQPSGPTWVNTTQGMTVDNEMSPTSDKPVANHVIKEYIDNNYARKDGYYSQLTAGSAENLVGQTVDSDTYLIRPTGGENNEVANGVASVLGMEGNSAVWKQLIKNGNFTTATNLSNWTSLRGTSELLNGRVKLSPTTTSSFIFQQTSMTINNLHKYYICCNAKSESSSTKVRFASTSLFEIPVTADFYIYKNIITADNDYVNFSFLGNTSSSVCYIKSVYIIDLTLLGIDNLTEVSKVEEWLAQHVGTKPYYAYNAGTILSAQTLGIKTYGQNLLNPTTKQAKLIPYTWVENEVTYSNKYTIKNVPSGATATFTPDATGVAESITITNNEFGITSYGSGILELPAATADTYVCMKWDKQKDDDVVPFEEHTQDFDVRKVYGKVSGAGEYVQCFQNGMRSAGSVHDTLSASEAVVKVGNVNLGNYSWARYQQTTTGVYYFRSSGHNEFMKSTIANAIVNKQYKNSANISDEDLSCAFNTKSIGSGELRVRNDSKTTAPTTEDNWLDGVFVNYELATPITYTNLIYRDGGIDRPITDVLFNIEVNNWSMEEQLMTPYVDGNPTSIPATIKTQYGMDAVEAIDTLQKTCYFAEDIRANLQALLTCINTNCAETLGGTFGISETATDKVFAFSFTPNTEPDVEPTNEGE